MGVKRLFVRMDYSQILTKQAIDQCEHKGQTFRSEQSVCKVVLFL